MIIIPEMMNDSRDGYPGYPKSHALSTVIKVGIYNDTVHTGIYRLNYIIYMCIYILDKNKIIYINSIQYCMILYETKGRKHTRSKHVWKIESS